MSDECPFCGENIDKWVDVTETVKIIPTVTSTEEKLGYCKLEIKGKPIGSLGMDGIRLYEKELLLFMNPLNDYREVSVGEAIRVTQRPFDGKPSYYNIFIKKDIWEIMNAKK